LYLGDKGDDQSLHVIDISTADKVYVSRARGRIGIVGWTPDSKNILFWLDDRHNILIFNSEKQVRLSNTAITGQVIWLDPVTYIFETDSELRIASVDGSSSLIDLQVESRFDVQSGK